MDGDNTDRDRLCSVLSQVVENCKECGLQSNGWWSLGSFVCSPPQVQVGGGGELRDDASAKCCDWANESGHLLHFKLLALSFIWQRHT